MHFIIKHSPSASFRIPGHGLASGKLSIVVIFTINNRRTFDLSKRAGTKKQAIKKMIRLFKKTGVEKEDVENESP